MINTLILILIILAGLGLLIYLVMAVKSTSLPELKDWHHPQKKKDNLLARKRKVYHDFSEYLAEEKEFLEQSYKEVEVKKPKPFDNYNRYVRNSQSSPYKNGEDLNRSFQCIPNHNKMKGGILLVHGLTDSPYYLRGIADIFAKNGYYVICLRLPGHGTYPGALLKVKWQDWYQAVTAGAQLVRKEIEKYNGQKFFVGGFSTGGALTLKYVLDKVMSGKKKDEKVPDKLFLFSPAIAVTGKAVFANWNKLVSWMRFFKKFKWKEIEEEYDPWKYNSFPKNAGDQIHLLTKKNKKLRKKLVSNRKLLQKVPPIYAFQSLVDATVITGHLIKLFREIGTETSELVFFDINRRFEKFLNPEGANNLLEEAKNPSAFKSRLMVVKNEGKSSDVKVFQYLPKEELLEYGKLKWPDHMFDMFALSHGCIPIPPGDKYYGQDSVLGGLNVKGEKGILAISPDTLIRVRYNPFFSVIKDRIEQVI